MTKSTGIHHVTAISGEAGRNVRFYRDVLGLRFVKRTVNFDDPGTWHLYYGDETGSPGTALTFFPWAHAAPGRPGAGEAAETAFAVPAGSIGYWLDRLTEFKVEHDVPAKRFGETVIAFRDPDGMRLALVGESNAAAVPGWAGGPVPAEHAIRGFSGQEMRVAAAAPTARVLTEVFGYTKAGTERDLTRYVAEGGSIATRIDLRETPGARANMGRGSIHHIAFRAADDAAQAAMAEALRGLGIAATEQKDRNYFRSVYFREPGGVIFEIATDTPGFTADEPVETLGEALKLPAWLEPHRAEIEQALPALP
jgi:glyoxalase family protein